jgi:hypothetical protein
MTMTLPYRGDFLFILHIVDLLDMNRKYHSFKLQKIWSEVNANAKHHKQKVRVRVRLFSAPSQAWN